MKLEFKKLSKSGMITKYNLFVVHFQKRNARGYLQRISDKLTINKVHTLLNKVQISHSGLDKEGQRVIRDSINKITRKIPVYKYYNDYSFTQVIPPSFHELLLFPDRLKVHGGIINFRNQLRQEIIKGLRNEFIYSSIMQSYYEQRVMEERHDSQNVNVHIKRRREDRINFRGFVPLFEVIRAVRSIYERNFTTAKDQKDFVKLVKNIILTSSEFVVSQTAFHLGYADIYFAQCFIPTKKYFSYWKQTVCKFTLAQTKELTDDYDIEDESYCAWISESDYGQTIFVEGDLRGMENYHEVSLDIIRLKPKEEEEEEEISNEKEKILTDQREPPINSSSDSEILMTEENDAFKQIHG